MNFQEKFFETTAGLRERAQAIACQVLEQAREQADTAGKRVEKRVADLKGSFVVLNTARRELNKVARRHGSRFVKQNAALAAKVRDDVTELARTTFASFNKPVPQARKRRAAPARKRTARAA